MQEQASVRTSEEERSASPTTPTPENPLHPLDPTATDLGEVKLVVEPLAESPKWARLGGGEPESGWCRSTVLRAASATRVRR